MSNINIEFVHICENIIISKSSNLSLINIFNQISALNFPAIHPSLTVVIGVSGDQGDYPVNIKISQKGESNNVIDFKSDVPMKVPALPGQGRFFTTFSPIVFKSAGSYEIEIKVQDKSKKLYLQVIKI